jgi:hypothetical protein
MDEIIKAKVGPKKKLYQKAKEDIVKGDLINNLYKIPVVRKAFIK